MRKLETPLELQETQLMRASYLNAVPELRWDFRYQEMHDEVYIEVDSDWEQCPRTRRWRCRVLEQTCVGQLLSAATHDRTQQRRSGVAKDRERLEISSFETSCSPWLGAGRVRRLKPKICGFRRR